MAGGRSEPPDPEPDKFYKCHPNTKVSAVVCIVCENAYHISCSKKLSGVKFISDSLIICKEHDDGNITSKFSDVATSDTPKIVENLIRENALLRQLNAELQDNNALLKELLNQSKSEKVNKPSYSEIIAKPKPQPKRIPKLIVKKTDQKTKASAKEYVIHYLTKEKHIQTKKVEFKSENEVIINCMTKESAIEAEKVLTKKLGQFCSVETEKIANPKMKIVGIDGKLKMDNQAMEDDINHRNFKQFESKCKIVHVYKNPRAQTQSAIIEVPSDIYQYIKENKSKVFLSYQNCKVYDIINARPCFNCGRFGHSGSKCHNDSICLKCAEPHQTQKCTKTPTSTFKCLNCVFSNSKYNSELDTNHVATDCNRCTILKSKIKKYIDMTDYPIKPTIPAYIGNVDTLQENRLASSTSLASLSSPVTTPTTTTIPNSKTAHPRSTKTHS